MKLAFTLHAVAVAFYGLALLLIPDSFLALYGVTFGPGAAVVIRFLGGLATGNAILSWLVREESSSASVKAVLLVFMFDWLVTLIAGVIGQFANAMKFEYGS